MPFKSAKQRKFLFANLPKVARKFAADTSKKKRKSSNKRKKT